MTKGGLVILDLMALAFVCGLVLLGGYVALKEPPLRQAFLVTITILLLALSVGRLLRVGGLFR